MMNARQRQRALESVRRRRDQRGPVDHYDIHFTGRAHFTGTSGVPSRAHRAAHATERRQAMKKRRSA